MPWQVPFAVLVSSGYRSGHFKALDASSNSRAASAPKSLPCMEAVFKQKADIKLCVVYMRTCPAKQSPALIKEILSVMHLFDSLTYIIDASSQKAHFKLCKCFPCYVQFQLCTMPGIAASLACCVSAALAARPYHKTQSLGKRRASQIKLLVMWQRSLHGCTR